MNICLPTICIFSSEVINILISVLIMPSLLFSVLTLKSLNSILICFWNILFELYIKDIKECASQICSYISHDFWNSSMLIYLIIVPGFSHLCSILLYQYICCSVSGDLGCFQFFCFINNAPTNIYEPVSFCTCGSFFRIPRITLEWNYIRGYTSMHVQLY